MHLAKFRRKWVHKKNMFRNLCYIHVHIHVCVMILFWTAPPSQHPRDWCTVGQSLHLLNCFLCEQILLYDISIQYMLRCVNTCSRNWQQFGESFLFLSSGHILFTTDQIFEETEEPARIFKPRKRQKTWEGRCLRVSCSWRAQAKSGRYLHHWLPDLSRTNKLGRTPRLRTLF